MGQPTSSTDIVRALTAAPEPFNPSAAWTYDAVASTFLRRGELVPPAEWSLMPGASRREIEVAGELVAASRAQGTRMAYGRHVRAWLAWAREHETTPLPADPGDLQLFLVDQAIDLGRSERDGSGRVQVEGRLVMSSVTQMMAALSRLHVLAGMPAPSTDPRISEFMSGLRRTLEQAPKGAKAALTWDLLTVVLRAQREAPMTDSQLRARAVQTLGAATGATAGQLARLLRSDLTEHGDELHIILPPGRRGAPRQRHVLAVGSDAGIHALRWLRVSSTWPGTALFVDRTGKALTRQGLHKVLLSGVEDEARTAGAAAISLADVRDRALLLAGWVSALRRSNLAALTWDDLTRTAAGWVLYVKRSKTDQEGKGRTVTVPDAPAGSAIDDPAGAIDDWHRAVTAVLGVDPRRIGRVPVFVWIDRHGRVRKVDGRPVGISGASISDIVKRRVVAAGLEDRQHPTRAGLWSTPGKGFSAHSLRAGFVTEGFKRKLTASEISAVTGHASLRTLDVYDRPEAPEVRAANAMLGALSEAAAGLAAPERRPERAMRRRGPDWDAPFRSGGESTPQRDGKGELGES